jgi:4-hydroxy-tetrahydrodipicolinate synthase
MGAQDTNAFRVLELARFAESIGVDGIQVGSPYYEPATPEDVFTLFKSVSDAVSVPLVVYNTWWTGTQVDMGYDQTARLLEVANVGALKWSSPNQLNYEFVLREFAHQLPIIDNQLCEIYSHMMGASGFVSHLPLAWPQYGLRLWNFLEQQRYSEALELVKRFRIPYYRLFSKAYAYSGSEGHFDKAILEILGEPMGPPRPPARPLSEQLLEEIRQMVRQVGVPA